jgi:hypothetical protein
MALLLLPGWRTALGGLSPAERTTLRGRVEKSLPHAGFRVEGPFPQLQPGILVAAARCS